MPLYEYECRGCQYRFEMTQKVNDPPAKACPHCGGKVTKVISSPAIVFKGSGWYVTDYSSKMKDPSGEQKKESPPPKETK